MVSGIVTAILLVLFLVGCAWAWSPRRRAGFDAAARLPLEGPADDGQEESASKPGEAGR